MARTPREQSESGSTRRHFLKQAGAAAAVLQAAGLSGGLAQAWATSESALSAEDRATMKALLEIVARGGNTDVEGALDGFASLYAQWAPTTRTAVSEWLATTEAAGGPNGLRAANKATRRRYLAAALAKSEDWRPAGPMLADSHDRAQTIHRKTRGRPSPDALTVASLTGNPLGRPHAPAPSYDPPASSQRVAALHQSVQLARALLAGDNGDAGNHPWTAPVLASDLA